MVIQPIRELAGSQIPEDECEVPLQISECFIGGLLVRVFAHGEVIESPYEPYFCATTFPPPPLWNLKPPERLIQVSTRRVNESPQIPLRKIVVFAPSVSFTHLRFAPKGSHFLTARCWRVTSWSGRPRETSDGKYRCCFPHSGQVTIIDWNGNSFTPEETARGQS